MNIYVPLLHHPRFESFDVNLHRLLSNKMQLKDAVVTTEQVLPEPEGFSQQDLASEEPLLLDDLPKLSWKQFEAFSAELLGKHFNASSVMLTASGNDFGADAVLHTEKGLILIQCKHTKRGSYDGYKAIQETAGAKEKYAQELNNEVSQLIFATNATKLSSRTRVIAKQYGVDVISGSELQAIVTNHSVNRQQILVRLDKKRLKLD